MKLKALFVTVAIGLSFFFGAYSQASNSSDAIFLLNQALGKAILCGGGGPDGAGCKGARAESIKYIKLAISKMQDAEAGK
jgi:hypothetical protein